MYNMLNVKQCVFIIVSVCACPILIKLLKIDIMAKCLYFCGGKKAEGVQVRAWVWISYQNGLVHLL